MNDRRAKHLAIVGAFGIGSIGDEAGLDTFVDLVADFAAVTVLMRCPTDAYARAHGVQVHNKLEHATRAQARGRAFVGMNAGDDPRPVEDIIALFGECDLVVLGPGDFFNEDVRGFLRGALAEMALMAWLAEMAGTPYMVYAASARQLRMGASRAQAGYILSHAAAVSVREERSRQLLVDAGVRGAERSVVLPDPVLAQGCKRQATVPGRLGVSVRYVGYHGPAVAERYLMLVRYCALTHPGEAYTIPMFASGCGYPDDREVASEILPRASHVERINMDPQTVMQHWSTCERALVTRLHATVMCYSLGIPTVALAYEPKVAGFCESVGMRWFDLDADPVEVSSALESATAPVPVGHDMSGYRDLIMEAAACKIS